MHCVRCATELIPGKRFCHACGTPVGSPCPSCGAVTEASYRFCPDCGHALAAGAAHAEASASAGLESSAASERLASAAPSERAAAGERAAASNGGGSVGANAIAGVAARGAVPRATGANGAVDARAQASDELRDRLRRHMPESLANRLVATPGAATGERKRVTVLFCDIAGSVEIADRLDAEEYRELLDQYVELCIREIYRFEGIVNQLAGDGVMALFGAPVAHEDAPERAIRAALAIREALVRLNETKLSGRDFELKARFGINTGPVVVGTVGNDLKMDYTATGDTTNLASRLESLAQPNAILISAATERLVRGRFEMREVGPLTVKGKRDAVVAYEVLGTLDDADAMSLRPGRTLTRLVGRDEELAQLEACYRRLHGRLPQVVSVIGEAGSGRSRLIYEFKQRLARELPIILEARCSSLSHMLPYAPWASMLRHYFELPAGEYCGKASQIVCRRLAEIDEHLVEIEPKLARIFSLPSEPTFESPDDVKRDVFEAVAHLFVAMSNKAPLVMILEDIDWMDDASREMLDLAVAKARGVRMMMVVSHRPDFEPHWRPAAAYTQLHLRSLAFEQATAVVRAIAGGELPAELEERICEKAEGNPFFLEEITRAILEDGSLVKSGGRLRLTRPIQDILIPETVQEVIGARIDRLRPAAKRTAQVAAVLGRQFRRDQLEQLLEGEGIDVAAELEHLEHRGIIHRKTVLSEDEFRFGESVTQEIAYDSLLLRERRALHGRIARLLDEAPGERTAERSALLAHHFARSDDRDKAIEALLRAAADAERVPSYHAAREFYAAAWGIASSALDDGAGADEALQRQALAAALGLCHMSIIYTSVGDMEEIERVARRGRALAQALDVKPACAAFPSYEGLAAIAGGSERFARGVALVEEGLAIARRENLGFNAVNISRGLAFAYLFDGRFVESLDIVEHALAELEVMQHPGKPTDLWFGVRFMRETVLFHADQVDAAMESARETHEHATRHNNRTVRTGTSSLLAQAHFMRGEYAEALRWAELSLEIAREIGNIGACRPSASLALAARVELGMPPMPSRFLRHIEAGLQGSTNLPLYVGTVIEALVAIGELKRGESVLEHVDRQSGGRFRDALCANARAELLRHDPRRLADAERHARRAVALAEETGARSTLATALVTAAQIALARGEEERAKHDLVRGLALARELRMGRYEQRAAALLADLAPGAVAAQPEP